MIDLKKPSRRRVLQILAATAGSGALYGTQVTPANAAARVLAQPGRAASWRGIVMGAPARLELYDHATGRARDTIGRAVAEARRLENIFSLYRSDSALCRLNRDGQLVNPPSELVELLSISRNIANATSGAFDVTMQPLWDVYARHFAANLGDTTGPAEDELHAVRLKVNYRSVSVTTDKVEFEHEGMAISLNGIAQGFVTDRVTRVLHSQGYETTVVDMGEPRVSVASSGAPMPVRVTDPEQPGTTLLQLHARNTAIATSQAAGTVFDPAGRHHHLFDPRTGLCANRYRSTTVEAPTATLADGLSTALTILNLQEIRSTLRQFGGTRAHVQAVDGDWFRF